MRSPIAIRTVAELEDALSEPSPGAIATMAKLEGDLILLGAGGKMGLTLARMARRASDLAGVQRRIIAVSRFGDSSIASRFADAGIETICCDLLNPGELEGLPLAPNVLYMVGTKFGTDNRQWMTWAVNSFLPGLVAHKYRHSKIVAFSTGNVYPLMPVQSGGCRETDPTNPVGEYAMSALGRERVFEYFNHTAGIPLAVIRVNYACELRYGVLVDIAQRVFHGEAVDLRMGYLNTIWQGDANAMTLQAFAHAGVPGFRINVTGLETVSVRQAATRFGQLFSRPSKFKGEEQPTALLSNAALAHKLFDPPQVSTEQLTRQIANWILQDGPTLGKPTHFETRDGHF